MSFARPAAEFDQRYLTFAAGKFLVTVICWHNQLARQIIGLMVIFASSARASWLWTVALVCLWIVALACAFCGYTLLVIVVAVCCCVALLEGQLYRVAAPINVIWSAKSAFQGWTPIFGLPTATGAIRSQIRNSEGNLQDIFLYLLDQIGIW